MKLKKHTPPRWASRLFEWYGRNTSIEDLQGDMDELFQHNLDRMSPSLAKFEYNRQVISLLFSYALRKRKKQSGRLHHPYSPIHPAMIKSNLKITYRNMLKNKFSAIINVGGLSIGMAVAMQIGLWVRDELQFDRYHENYDRIAQVKQQATYNGTIDTNAAIPLPLDAEMRQMYGNDFKHIVIASMTWAHGLAAGDKKVSYEGSFMAAGAPEMFSLRMLKGSRQALTDASSMLISATLAKALFGEAEPLGETIKLDNMATFNVAGVYEDLPLNSSLHRIAFMAPWEYYRNSEGWLKQAATIWDDNSFLMYVQIADHADMTNVSEKIKNIKLNRISSEMALFKPTMFLHPMSKWHLYSEFTNGANSGGAIKYVWLFGIIGMFVLLLACINFMNLSTARSEKRAKETGIRKAIGSQRSHLITQFFCESLFIAAIAFLIALLLTSLALPFFNDVASKDINILWDSPLFWSACICFTVLTGLLAGSYPALYLSSFQPVKVLKGTFKAGQFASLPRKVLVVVQFTVSVVLIIGTVIVFQQIEFAKHRPVGYNRQGLINIETSNDDLHNHFEAMRTQLLASGVIAAVSESSSPATTVNNTRTDVSWSGKDPAMTAEFNAIRISTDFGKTMGWQFVAGRDLSEEIKTDELAVVLNEAAVRYMGLKNPVGETIHIGRRDYVVVGVIRDMVMASPYEPVKQTIFNWSDGGFGYVNIRIDPRATAQEALPVIELACKTFSPDSPFSFSFADDDYARKFASEERIGKLAGFFSVLAIFISCIGLFGMASFMAEQRVKEIGVRKVLGASVFGLWSLMSKEFVILVTVSLFISVPSSYYLMNAWVEHYGYHIEISWTVFLFAAVGAIVITLATVSYQSIRAALANPVESLRTE